MAKPKDGSVRTVSGMKPVRVPKQGKSNAMDFDFDAGVGAAVNATKPKMSKKLREQAAKMGKTSQRIMRMNERLGKKK